MKYINCLIFLLLLSSCASPKLTNANRGKYETRILENPDKVMTVNVGVLPLPKKKQPAKEKAKTFFDLRDSIPHKFLAVVGAKAKNVDEILAAIKTDLSIVRKKMHQSFLRKSMKHNFRYVLPFQISSDISKNPNFCIQILALNF